MGRLKGVCAVATCPSPQDASFHRFPKNSKLRALWLKACKRLDPVNPDTARICSSHFRDSDFERDLVHELLNLPLRKILKGDVVPSLKLSFENDNPRKRKSKENRSRLTMKRERKEAVESRTEVGETLHLEGKTKALDTKGQFTSEVEKKLRHRIQQLESKVKRLQMQLKALRNENKTRVT